METWATVCDAIIECYNREDEPDYCRKNKADTYLAISIGSILAIYLGLKSYFNIIKISKEIVIITNIRCSS